MKSDCIMWGKWWGEDDGDEARRVRGQVCHCPTNRSYFGQSAWHTLAHTGGSHFLTKRHTGQSGQTLNGKYLQAHRHAVENMENVENSRHGTKAGSGWPSGQQQEQDRATHSSVNLIQSDTLSMARSSPNWHNLFEFRCLFILGNPVWLNFKVAVSQSVRPRVGKQLPGQLKIATACLGTWVRCASEVSVLSVFSGWSLSDLSVFSGWSLSVLWVFSALPCVALNNEHVCSRGLERVLWHCSALLRV